MQAYNSRCAPTPRSRRRTNRPILPTATGCRQLIASLPRPADEATLRAHAIACNAVIDGLWLEGSALPEAFAPGEVERIGLHRSARSLDLIFFPICQGAMR
jgi:hypothetical protein